MVMYSLAHARAGRRTAAAVVVVMLALLAIGVSEASAQPVYDYFGPAPSCCTNREFSAYLLYELSNASSVTNEQVVCVQEYVYPNYPSTSGAFYDNYKCANNSVAHALNGNDVDDALCWVNNGPVEMTCAEAYN